MARTRKKQNAPEGSTRAKGDVLEKIIAEMHNIPDVKVERNIFLPVHDGSGATREIDVLITSQVAGYPVQIAIECKNENKPTGIAKIDEFIGKLNDVGLPIQLGIFVSTSRYESGAIRRAKAAGIKTFLLQGVTKALSQTVKDVFQSNLYLLLSIGNIVITNNIAGSATASEILFFRDENGKICGSVPDLIWKEWKSGHLSNQIGNHEVSLSLPPNWQQIVNGEIAKVSGIKVTYQIEGYAISFLGTLDQYNLVNAEDKKIEKSQTVARFPHPNGKYPTVYFKTEDELTAFKNEAKGFLNVFVGRFRLPRIKWYAFYWPPSQTTMKKLNKRVVEAWQQGAEFDLTSISISEIEGDDLSAIWEPIIDDHPMLKRE